jgi:RNA polymerase sigma-70 factor (ECF subfamily)
MEPGSGDGTTYADIGQRLGKSESAIKSEASRLRLRYGELVRSEIAQTVASVTEIDDEVRHLLTVIGG